MRAMKTVALSLFAAVFTATGAAANPYDDPETVWTLVELDGAPFAQRATLSFPDAGSVSGSAPCNRYFGPLIAEFPAFATGPLAATRMACLDLAAEERFLTALSAMTAAELRDGLLILTGTMEVAAEPQPEEAVREESEPEAEAPAEAQAEADGTEETEVDGQSGETEADAPSDAQDARPTQSVEVTMVFSSDG